MATGKQQTWYYEPHVHLGKSTLLVTMTCCAGSRRAGIQYAHLGIAIKWGKSVENAKIFLTEHKVK